VNPEFQRNVWLEMTPHRLVVTPVLLVAVFGLVFLLEDQQPLVAMGHTAYWIVAGVGILWGARVASESVVSEVQDGTWDQQRLTSIEPWAMTWGKLFGAPVFTWYLCAPCLAVMVVSASTRMSVADALIHVALLVMLLVFAQAVGLLASLHLSRRATRLGRHVTMGLHFVGLLAALPLLFTTMPAFIEEWRGTAHWFGRAYAVRDFVLLSEACFTAWAVAGCYRLMRAELQMRNAPWVWLGFVVFCMVYGAGLSYGEGGEPWSLVTVNGMHVTGAALVTAHLAALALAYGALFMEPKDPVALRRLLDGLRLRDWSTVAEVVPRWLCVVPLAVTTLLAVVLSNSITMVVCASSLAFFARDAGLVMFLNLGQRRERADTAALFYLMVLYALAPALLGAAFGVSPAGWLVPAVDGNIVAGVLPAVVQAGVMWFFVSRRWQAVQNAWR
jgi:hypothetical protein